MSSAVDKIGIQGVRAFALVLGVIGLLLDLTLIGIAVGAVVGFFGVVSALLCPRDRFRMIVLSLNVFALVVVGVFVLLLNVA